MPKKLLSPKLSQVIEDIEATRLAINEKYALNGSPEEIPAPLSSGDMADAVKAITTVNELPALDGTIDLSYNKKEQSLIGGHYKDGINATLKDYAIAYIWNRKGLPAQTQYVNVNTSFQIPVFNDIASPDGEEFLGWSHMPNDEDPEYLAGDIVNHFQYEPRIDDPSYISYLYAVWRLLKINPIQLEFAYANGGKLNSSKKEIVKMKVIGQDPKFPGLVKREYEVEGNPSVKKDIETGSDYYTHELTFNEIGIFPVVVTHTGKTGEPEIAFGTIKVADTNGTMSDSGQMSVYGGVGAWYDSRWVSTSIMKGCYISSAKLEVCFSGHGGGYDALAIFVKKTDGSTYVIYDFGNTTVRKVNLSKLGTTAMCPDGPTGEITLGSVTLQRADLASDQHYVPGPSTSDVFTFNKADDIRQIRFFVYSSHDSPACFSGAIINYNIDYAFDLDLWEADKNTNFDNNTDNDDPGSNPTPDPDSAPDPTPEPEPEPEPEPTNPLLVWPNLPADNYSNENLDDCFGEKWGYSEMLTHTSLRNNSGAYIELYRRIYNAIKHGDSKTTYQYQEYNTTNIKTQQTLIGKMPVEGLKYDINALLVPFSDTGLNAEAAEYVWKCVCIDCPEIIWRWNACEDKVDGGTDIFATATSGGVGYLLLPYYTKSTQNSYLQTCENTFKEICNQVKTSYGITYQEDTFSANNARYTAAEKKKVAKVIHDYLELHNVYGFTTETDGLNQTMYPALSKGVRHPVCASYAQAFKYCCWKWGIHCVCVNGGCGNNRDGRHQWNLVCYESGAITALAANPALWQEVDCTWDDPYGSEGKTNNPTHLSWKYFNVTTSALEADTPTKDYIQAVKDAGYSFTNGEPGQTPRSRFATKYPFRANTATAINIEHYISYPANGTCTSNRYDFFDNTNNPPAPKFNGKTYLGF